MSDCVGKEKIVRDHKHSQFQPNGVECPEILLALPINIARKAAT